MKIAFLNLYSGVNNRGAESFVHELSRRLAEKHEVKFFRGVDYKTPIIKPTHHLNFLKIFFLDGADLSVLIFTLKVFTALWRGDFDWIIPMNGFWQVFICKIIAFFQRSKILITGHSGPGWDERWNLYLNPDVFVATTEPTAQWAKRTCPWTKVVTIPYGVDIETFTNAKSIKINLERPIFLCPAATVEYKQIDLAIKAVAKLGKGSLLHLGTGLKLEDIKTLGQKLLGNNRFESKSVDYTKMPEYYKACDAVTLPSKPQENSPMVFLEAMAAGKITITTDTPRARWVLESAGIFVDPTDINEYAKALWVGLENKTDTTKKAREFSWDKIVRRYEEIIFGSL